MTHPLSRLTRFDIARRLNCDGTPLFPKLDREGEHAERAALRCVFPSELPQASPRPSDDVAGRFLREEA